MNDLDLRLQVVQGHVNHCVTFDVEQGISETVDRDSVPKDDQYEMTYRVSWSRDRWRHVTLKGQTRDLSALRAQYVENGCI